MRSSSRIIGAELARRARPLAEVRSTRVVTPSVSVGRLPYSDLGPGTPFLLEQQNAANGLPDSRRGENLPFWRIAHLK